MPGCVSLEAISRSLVNCGEVVFFSSGGQSERRKWADDLHGFKTEGNNLANEPQIPLIGPVTIDN